MTDQDFSLQAVYAFLRSKGFANEAKAIRNEKPGSNASLIKHALAVDALTRHGLLNAFLVNHWPHGTTSEGQQELARYNRIHDLYQKSRTLTCEQIEEAVKKHNSDSWLHGDETALRKTLLATQTLAPCLSRFVGEVWVIADWGSIEFFPFEDRLAMAEEIDKRWPLIAPTENPTDWDAETKRLLEAVDDLANRTVLLPKKRDRRSQLSFLSKYLHFCVDSGFPIWDSNALLVLGGSEDANWDTYKQWVVRVRQEVTKHKGCLKGLRTDGESLVRTLDKALYTMGGEIVS